ncbi:hypothetical protein SLEP1_g37268 [Rubroshorea leprosula]|uniref:Uncharacterized protein n=1 Tax=Rubroshorea leprosula TaxID=152421 RepID=A0AAV5KUH2_9ROSI|nr:hypothetical protein SLEP1_g37268 [Rubroshorea leprosula]
MLDLLIYYLMVFSLHPADLYRTRKNRNLDCCKLLYPLGYKLYIK